MSPEDRDEMIDALCQASDEQLDASVNPRLQSLKARANDDMKDELLGIIDDCCYASLTSDFTISLMRIIWMNCGGTEQELQERNLNSEMIEELRPRFKWQTH